MTDYAQQLIDELEKRQKALDELERRKEAVRNIPILHQVNREHALDLIWSHLCNSVGYDKLEKEFSESQKLKAEHDAATRKEHEEAIKHQEEQHLKNIKFNWKHVCEFIATYTPKDKLIEFDRKEGKLIWTCNMCRTKNEFDLFNNKLQNDQRFAVAGVLDKGIWITWKCSHPDYKEKKISRFNGFHSAIWLDRDAIAKNKMNTDQPIQLTNIPPDELEKTKPRMIVHGFMNV